jgi:hypothetical protein
LFCAARPLMRFYRADQLNHTSRYPVPVSGSLLWVAWRGHFCSLLLHSFVRLQGEEQV